MLYLKKYNALFLAILFHLTGVLGILFTPYKDWFVSNTPLVLFTMFLLLSIDQKRADYFKYLIFFIVAFLVGMTTEIIGVNTSLLFGHYQYENVFGPKLFGVPFLIGFNWFIIVYCAGSFFSSCLSALKQKYPFTISPIMTTTIVILGGALMTTGFDFILEPVAVELKFWTWDNGLIPLFNYACWFMISAALLGLKVYLRINPVHPFATSLFIVQFLFFLLLNCFL